MFHYTKFPENSKRIFRQSGESPPVRKQFSRTGGVVSDSEPDISFNKSVDFFLVPFRLGVDALNVPRAFGEEGLLLSLVGLIK